MSYLCAMEPQDEPEDDYADEYEPDPYEGGYEDYEGGLNELETMVDWVGERNDQRPSERRHGRLYRCRLETFSRDCRRECSRFFLQVGAATSSSWDSDELTCF